MKSFKEHLDEALKESLPKNANLGAAEWHKHDVNKDDVGVTDRLRKFAKGRSSKNK